MLLIQAQELGYKQFLFHDSWKLISKKNRIILRI